MLIQYQSLDEIAEVAKKIIKFAGNTTIWLFEGEMGAGKTTLIKAIGKELGILDEIQSPSYAIVNEYHNLAGDFFYHFDFYRIKHETEALDIGLEEYFYSTRLCWVEWPSKIERLIPKQHLEISIEIKELTRHISLKHYE